MNDSFIHNNYIKDFEGISMQSSSNISCIGNFIVDNEGLGIHFDNSNSITIIGQFIRNTDTGILGWGSDFSILNNTIVKILIS